MGLGSGRPGIRKTCARNFGLIFCSLQEAVRIVAEVFQRRENQIGGFPGMGGDSCDSRFVFKPDVAIASEVSIFSKSSCAITDLLAKKN